MLVYCIKNKVNGKEYVGLTSRPLNKRWKQHISESNRENCWEWNTPLGRAIRKYENDCFDVFILKECVSVEDMKSTEIRYINERKSHISEGGYNITKGGDGRFGVKLSEETKLKIGKGNKGKIISNHQKQILSKLKKETYQLGGHPGAQIILVNKTEKFQCIKEFTNKYNLNYTSFCRSLRNNNGSMTFKNFFVEKINE